ncbi:hypothetical protein BIW11_13802, partial [Tropilaelaps mercedesae]
QRPMWAWHHQCHKGGLDVSDEIEKRLSRIRGLSRAKELLPDGQGPDGKAVLISDVLTLLGFFRATCGRHKGMFHLKEDDRSHRISLLSKRYTILIARPPGRRDEFVDFRDPTCPGGDNIALQRRRTLIAIYLKMTKFSPAADIPTLAKSFPRMPHIWILLAFGIASLTKPCLTTAPDVDDVAGETSLRREPAQQSRERRQISDTGEHFNYGRPPKLSVRFDQQELPSEGFAKPRLDALKDLVSLQFRTQLRGDSLQSGDANTRNTFKLRDQSIVGDVSRVQHKDDQSEQKISHDKQAKKVSRGPTTHSEADAEYGGNRDYIVEAVARIRPNVPFAAKNQLKPPLHPHPSFVDQRHDQEQAEAVDSAEIRRLRQLGSVRSAYPKAAFILGDPPVEGIYLPERMSRQNPTQGIPAALKPLIGNKALETNRAVPTRQPTATAKGREIHDWSTTPPSAERRVSEDLPREELPSENRGAKAPDDVASLLIEMLTFNKSSPEIWRTIGEQLLQTTSADITVLENEDGEVIWMDLQLAPSENFEYMPEELKPPRTPYDKTVRVFTAYFVLVLGFRCFQ